jgi:uncharacterized membrane protein YkvA (DUF1232 family)
MLLPRIQAWARALRRDAVAVYLAARDPRTPWWVRGLALVVAAYALSPIDLIPDFIPVLGYLDDVLIVPLGLWLVLRLIAPAVLADARVEATRMLERPRSRAAAYCIVGIWVLGLAACAYWWFTR